MADDYIDRQAVLDAVDDIHQEHLYKQIGDKDTYTPYNEGWADACDRIDSVLRGLPSADVQPVVQCKDCDSAECSGVMIYCFTHGRYMRDNDFCSYGERKDG